MLGEGRLLEVEGAGDVIGNDVIGSGVSGAIGIVGAAS